MVSIWARWTLLHVQLIFNEKIVLDGSSYESYCKTQYDVRSLGCSDPGLALLVVGRGSRFLDSSLDVDEVHH
jgi:hypothetical protein